MKLSNRIHLILLPSIVSIFLLSLWLRDVYDERQAATFTQRQLHKELEKVGLRIANEIAQIETLVRQITNSHEYLSYLARSDSYPLTRALQKLLDQQRAQARELRSTVDSIYLISTDGKILLASNDRDVFEDPVIPDIPVGYRYWEAGEGSVSTFQEVFLFRTSTAGMRLAKIYALNVNFLSDLATRPMARDDAVYFLTISNADYLLTGTPLIEQFFEKFYDIEVREKLGDAQIGVTERVDVTLEDGGFVAFYQHPLLDMDVRISSEFLATFLRPERHRSATITFILIVLSYSALLVLIRRQIINPIQSLTSHIHNNEIEELDYMSGKDEVSVLNNAYLDLLSDVQRMAKYDSLTRLANRHSFQSFLSRALDKSRETKSSLAILYIDLDNFKQVNDHYGHKVGDDLLVEFSQRLVDSIRSTDNWVRFESDSGIARLAGDEFAVVLTDIGGPEVPANVAERILGMFKSGFEVAGHRHNVKASIGIALYPDDGDEVSRLIQNADAAMYQAKSMGRNRFQFFTEAIADKVQERVDVELEIENALANDEFHLVFMPIYRSVSLEIIGAEVLLRSKNPLLASCGPEIFIPIAESTGLINQIDLWVVERALCSFSKLLGQCDFEGILCINISAIELHNAEFPKAVAGFFQKYDIDPARIEFEITETSFVASDEESVNTLNVLKSLGVRLSLDDFGTGYTAFSQLIHFPVDTLKIDRSFIGACDDRCCKDFSMLEILVKLASLYGLNTIAEGIETKEQLDCLTELGCQGLQGYYFEMPLTDAELLDLLSRKKQRVN